MERKLELNAKCPHQPPVSRLSNANKQPSISMYHSLNLPTSPMSTGSCLQFGVKKMKLFTQLNFSKVAKPKFKPKAAPEPGVSQTSGNSPLGCHGIRIFWIKINIFGLQSALTFNSNVLKQTRTVRGL